jgi:starch phosphorylase
LKRATQKGAAGNRIDEIRNDLRNKWDGIKFGEQQTEKVENGYVFHIRLILNDINLDQILIELYAEGIHGAAERIKMRPVADINNGKEHIYQAQVTSTRPASDYSIRIIPNYESVSVPLEDNLIRWQR